MNAQMQAIIAMQQADIAYARADTIIEQNELITKYQLLYEEDMEENANLTSTCT